MAISTTDAESLSLQFLLHGDTDAPKPTFIIKSLATSLVTALVGDLRKIIAGNPQQKEYSLYTFCSKDGASLPDTYPLKEAVALYGAKLATDQGLIPVYIRAPPVSIKSSAPVALMPAPTLDATAPTKPDLITSAALTAQKSAYTATQYSAAYTAATAAMAASSVARASDLKEVDWFVIAQNNALHRAYTVDRQPQPGSTAVNAVGMSNARRTAFQFKKRDIPNFSVSGSGTSDTMLSLRVPNYIVDDQSYVTVYETSNTFQASLAESAFAEADVKASVSGGAFGYSLGVSASYSQSSSSSTASASMQVANRMHISYNFPRVRLILDEESLEMTDQCKLDITKVVDITSMRNFMGLYGQFFPTRIQLGGRLFASDESSTVSGSSASEKARSMKVAAAVSFSSTYVSGSVSASYGTSSNAAQSSSSSNFSSSLSWQATGGDTLLCNNPAAWCATVAPFYSWRITKQDQITHILDLIGNMPGYSALPAQWRALDTSGTSTRSITVPSAITFSLQSTRTDVSNLTLTALSAANWSLADVQKKRNENNMSTPNVNMTELAQFGTIVDYQRPDKTALMGDQWQLDNLDGSIVAQPKFETKYIMKNISMGVNMMRNQDVTNRCGWTHNPTFRHPIIFKNPDGGSAASDITEGTRLTIFVCYSADYTSDGFYPVIMSQGVTTNNYVLMRDPTTKATWTMKVR